VKPKLIRLVCALLNRYCSHFSFSHLTVASGGKLWEMKMEYSMVLFLCQNMDCQSVLSQGTVYLPEVTRFRVQFTTGSDSGSKTMHPCCHKLIWMFCFCPRVPSHRINPCPKWFWCGYILLYQALVTTISVSGFLQNNKPDNKTVSQRNSNL